MLKVAILDDYQNVAQQFVDLENYQGKYELKFSVNHFWMNQMQLSSWLI